MSAGQTAPGSRPEQGTDDEAAAAAAAAAAGGHPVVKTSASTSSQASTDLQQHKQQQQGQSASGLQLRSLSSTRRRPEVWGWLAPAPGGSRLPFVLLQGRGVAIGRGRDAYHERLPQLMLPRSASGSAPAATAATTAGSSSGVADIAPLGSVDDAAFREVAAASSAGSAPPAGAASDAPPGNSSPKDSTFVEVADGRVSRLHAWVRFDGATQQAVLEDLSSNGTFLNGERVGRGQQRPLADGDRISLVLSVAPLAEQAFIFRKGDPRSMEPEAVAGWIEDAAKLWQTTPATSPTAAGGAPSRRLSGGLAATTRRLSRSTTSTYSTMHATTLEDLQCDICLSTLRDCVALEPCGHNFCAPCLSHHLAALLSNGQPLACPLRCAHPERVVINSAVRQLVDSLTGQKQSQQRHQQLLRRPSQQQRQQSSVLEPLPEAAPAAPAVAAAATSSSSYECPPLQLPHQLQPVPEAATDSGTSRSGDGGGSGSGSTGSLTAAASSKHSPAAATAAAAAAAAPPPVAAAVQPLARGRGSMGSGSMGAGASAGGTPTSSAASPQYYPHLQLWPSSSRRSSLSSPPPSPFQTAPGFRLEHEVAPEEMAGPTSLPGAPTMPATAPLGTAATAPPWEGSQASVVGPGEPTMSVSATATGHNLPGKPLAAGEQQQQQQQQQQQEGWQGRRQQQQQQTSGAGGQGPAAAAGAPGPQVGPSAVSGAGAWLGLREHSGQYIGCSGEQLESPAAPPPTPVDLDSARVSVGGSSGSRGDGLDQMGVAAPAPAPAAMADASTAAGVAAAAAPAGARHGGHGQEGGSQHSPAAAEPAAPPPSSAPASLLLPGSSSTATSSSGDGGAGSRRLPPSPLGSAADSAGDASSAEAFARLSSYASSAGASEADDMALPMHPLCPLHDAVLPLDTASLKSRQLAHSLELLQAAGDEDEEAAMDHLEALARLAWSDESARDELGQLQGVEAVVQCMQQHFDSEGVQCNGCLALMALVRGEGDASDANRLRMAACGGVQAVADGMAHHEEVAMVQLSGLLCLVPLALENTYMQVLVARTCLPAILRAIQEHPAELEVVSKALIMLGVLGQGEEEAHEAIRGAIMESTPYPRIVAIVLAKLGTLSEDVLWAALFSLAVIARDSSSAYLDHLQGLAAAGVLPALEEAMDAYRQLVEEQGIEADEMILRAGDFLCAVLSKAEKLLWLRRTRRLTQLALVGLAAFAAFRWLRQRAGQGRHGGGGGR